MLTLLSVERAETDAAVATEPGPRTALAELLLGGGDRCVARRAWC